MNLSKWFLKYYPASGEHALEKQLDDFSEFQRQVESFGLQRVLQRERALENLKKMSAEDLMEIVEFFGDLSYSLGSLVPSKVSGNQPRTIHEDVFKVLCETELLKRILND